MLTFYEFVQTGGSLHVFDIDETLFHTSATVHIIDKKTGKRVKSLTNQSFNDYKLQPGEDYDFSEFRSSEIFDTTSKPVRRMLAKLKALQASLKGTKHKIIIVTARNHFDDKQRFFRSFTKYGIDMNDLHVHLTGSDDSEPIPEKKARVVELYLERNNYDKVYMYDDSMKILQTFKKLGGKYPDKTFVAHHVQPNGSTKIVK